MSRHRVKNISYDDDDYDDDGYDSQDPEELEYLQECTTEVLNQLRTGEPSVTATREEVQDSLYYYYNDVDKTVNYLRSEFFSFLYSLTSLSCQSLTLEFRQESERAPEEADRCCACSGEG
jgi:hypothetical protein